MIEVKRANPGIENAVHTVQRNDPQAVKQRDHDQASHRDRAPQRPVDHAWKSKDKAKSAHGQTGNDSGGLEDPALVIFHLFDQVASQGLSNRFLGPEKTEHGKADEDRKDSNPECPPARNEFRSLNGSQDCDYGTGQIDDYPYKVGWTNLKYGHQSGLSSVCQKV